MKTTLVALLAAAVASVFGFPVPESDPEANLVDYGDYLPQRADTRYKGSRKDCQADGEQVNRGCRQGIKGARTGYLHGS